MTQNDLELKTGITQGRISKFESGHAIPKPVEKEKIAAALDVPIDELEFYREDGSLI
jgi:transcriptional regulator with XRE-family HTH domain